MTQYKKGWSWDIAQRCVVYPDCGLFFYIGDMMMKFVPCRVTKVKVSNKSYVLHGYMQEVRNLPTDIKDGITDRIEEELVVLSFMEDTREATRRFKEATPVVVGDKVLLYGLYVEEVRIKGNQENGENDFFIEFGNLLSSFIFHEKINDSAENYAKAEKEWLEKALQYEWDVAELLENGKVARVVRGDTSLYRTIDTVRTKEEIIKSQVTLADILMKMKKERESPDERVIM